MSSAYHQGMMLTLWAKRRKIIDQDSVLQKSGIQVYNTVIS